MAQLEINETILIVTGSELVPEEKDRPLAYRLKALIDPRGQSPYHRAIVVSDRWYMDNELFQICPTIFIGGPGVNQATSQVYKKIPVAWTDNTQAFVQIAISGTDAKAALWGMNQDGTRAAVEVFIGQNYLDYFLKVIWQKPGEAEGSA
ncbi:MAG TPA: hypothetical protein PK878_10270 [bacterium]|nr:hypothetical protein [Candidatus Omnitrophota bacterium]HOJ60659.1 hypothetical protein [bacterium]HOL93879.1 hypothetical protein [bacterium]HPP00442.1 hypothetical protein [bacterium]